MITINSIFTHLKTILYYKCIFGAIGYRSSILKPLKIDGAKRIYIGEKTFISYNTWLAAMPLTHSKTCELRIGDNCSIGNFNHIYATNKIIIKDGVLTADKVYISDNIHGYTNPDIFIKFQPIVQKNEVVIGEGSWLGENVCVIGASIGKHCVIGANSVVTRNIPDFCVAVGSPAVVIKRYDFKTRQWIKTDKQGNF